MTILHVNPDHPQAKAIGQIVDILKKGGVIIYPTDTLYGLGCDISKPEAIDRICKIKHTDPKKAQMSFICHDLGDLSRYTRSISTPLYRILKSHLPGPYTFILPASREVPKMLKSKKDTVGLRVPDNPIARAIARELGNAVLSTSLPGEMEEAYNDPAWIYEKFKKQVDLVVSGGIGNLEPSTVIDLTSGEPEIIRQGAGSFIS